MGITIPTKMPVAWAQAATAPYVHTVPIPSQIGTTPGRASFTDGFVPDNFSAISAGGIPPYGDDVNGVMQAVTQWLRWVQAGAPIAYDSAFQSAIGGYPQGAIVADPTTVGLFWFNSAVDNTTDPTAGGAGWSTLAVGSGGVASTGDWKWRPTQEVLPGWVKANATTIGSPTSGASQLADLTALPLYKWFWTNFSNTQCPVSTGRGANPTADFNANKTLQVLDMRGIAPIGMDTMGGSPTTKLNGVPVTFGSPTSAGSIIGEILHTLILSELAQHNHGFSDPGHNHGTGGEAHFHTTVVGPLINGSVFMSQFGTGIGVPPGGAPTSSNVTGLTIAGNTTGITISNNGSDGPHNTVALSMTGTHHFKL